MIKLTNSGVLFNAEEHTYFFEGKQLQGITGLIKERLFPDMYQSIPAKVLEEAAKRGTMVHEKIELYEQLGIDPDNEETKNYIRIKNEHGWKAIANEYLITDSNRYASAIDIVFTDDDNSVILADIKTTSKYYEESVSWQLSVYAYLFRIMNPTIKVKGLYCLWLRENKSKLYEVRAHSTEEVEALLYGEEFSSEIVLPDYIIDNEQRLIAIDEQMEFLKAERETIISRILRQMNEDKSRSWDTGKVLFTRKDASIKSTFDSKRFKEENEDIYSHYLKTIATNPSLSVKIR